MNHTQVLKQAWNTLWRYRVLWLFGVLLALTTFSWSGSTVYSLGDGEVSWEETGIISLTRMGEEQYLMIVNSPETDGQQGGRLIVHYNTPSDPASYREGDFVLFVRPNEDVRGGFVTRDHTAPVAPRQLDVSPGIFRTAITAIFVLSGLMLVLLIVGVIMRYVAEVALIKMVDRDAETSEKVGFATGWRLGWSRAAWRLFLIDFLIGLTILVAVVALGFIIALPLIAVADTGNLSGILIAAFSAGGMVLFLIFAGIVVGIALSLLKPFYRRAAALEDRGVVDSIREGTRLVVHHLRDAGLMWLAMLAIDLIWPLALVPVVFLLLAAGLLLGGLTGALFGGVTALFVAGAVPWIVGGLGSVAIFLVTLAMPLVFLGGLREVYQSTSWTLTFRELRALELVKKAPAPKEALSGA